jgi:hypothetical protein
LWRKGLNAKDIHKKIFPVYGGKCLSREAVNGLVEKRGKYFPDDEEVETEARKCLRQQLKDFYAAGFGAFLRRWDMCINVGGEYVEK